MVQVRPLKQKPVLYSGLFRLFSTPAGTNFKFPPQSNPLLILHLQLSVVLKLSKTGKRAGHRAPLRDMRFVREDILPRTESLKHTIASGAKPVMRMAEQDFIY